MRKIPLAAAALLFMACNADRGIPPEKHPDSNSWPPLFDSDLSNAQYPDGVWTFDGGVLTASEDQNIWTENTYDHFILDLEFRNDEGTNSGVVVHCSDLDNWIPNSIEIQIADDYAKKWAESHPTWQCGAFFGRRAATERTVKRPGEWNRMTITCQDSTIWVMLNGTQINQMNMADFTDAKVNPDGVPAPPWLSKAPAAMDPSGYIGLQGKHAGAPIYFRNIRIKTLQKQ